MIDQNKLARLFEKFPTLFSVVNKLNELGVSWMIGGSGSLFLLGNDREPGDIDILLLNEEHDLVDDAFVIKSFTYKSPIENVRNSNPGDNHDIQFTSHLKLSPGNYDFDLSISRKTINSRLEDKFLNQNIYILPPEEVIIIKGILQRGKEEGKNDIEDVIIFINTGYVLNMSYLNTRINELKAKDRIEKRLSFLFK